MSAINDITKMEDELASLRLSDQTQKQMLAVQDFELAALRKDNNVLRSRIERELLRSREMELIVRGVSTGLVSSLAAYAKGRDEPPVSNSEEPDAKATAVVAEKAEPPDAVLEQFRPKDHLAAIPDRPAGTLRNPRLLVEAAEGIGRPHRTALPDGPDFSEVVDVPVFLRGKS